MIEMDQSAPTTKAVAVSAPGKVLVSGGYLILDRAYEGLVFGLDARIHAIASENAASPQAHEDIITVKSPQFLEAEWRYRYKSLPQNAGIEILSLDGPSLQLPKRNRFIETALVSSLSYACACSRGVSIPRTITILADADYYSSPARSAPNTIVPPTNEGRFVSFGVTLSDAKKTGLGSSAALVTAVCAAIITYCLPQLDHDIERESGVQRLHNLAQIVHSTAQGKIGSGFDVAAAVYGSCLYRRFSPQLLSTLGEANSPAYSERLKTLVQLEASPQGWDMEITKARARLPTQLRIVLCDVDCGSESVGMASRVLKWRKTNASTADALWTLLDQANNHLTDLLVAAASESQYSDSDAREIIEGISSIRRYLRKMSAAAEVPIEPPSQTILLDACTATPGVIGGMVPGAGGFDAIVLFVQDKPSVLADLKRTISRHELEQGNQSNSPRLGVRLLGVKQEFQGLKTEPFELYSSWIKAA